ncbi:MAG TPA: hypothetical protein PLE73_00630 [Spirochaetota bacterium]|nr:hypothetical protein [Spirochaetota bacterium]HPI21670.1 hypothetical protein [Spirochaetota bacterium]HPU87199.1 hypothetical protein [Spirochaetota bacterium]
MTPRRAIASGAAVFAIVAACAGCASVPAVTAYDYVCALHGTHHLRDRAHTAACFGFPLAEYDNIRFFSREGAAQTDAQYDPLRARLTDEVENAIVDAVMQKIQSAMGASIKRHWRFEQIKVPVVLRAFRHDSPGAIRATVVAAMHKDRLAPAAIIKYLPLEYKMDIIDYEERFKDTAP